MESPYNTMGAEMHLLEDDAAWSNLYHTLRVQVKYWVYTHRAPSWFGQEEEIVSDIVQETLLRVWVYLRREAQGRVAPVESLPNFCTKVALNYGKDLWRHDHRLARPTDEHWEYIVVCTVVEDDIVEHISQHELFVFLARAIRDFPAKQREALLTDLAHRADLSESSSLLQQALSDVGIHLADYRKPPSENAMERNRHWSLLSIAYKRLRTVVSECEAIPEVSEQRGMTRRQKLPRKENIRHNLPKMSSQNFKFSQTSSSVGIEKASSQEIVQAKKVDATPKKVLPEAFLTREITDMEEQGKEKAHTLEEPDVATISEEPELAMLAFRLRQTLPPAVVPAFQEELESELVDTLLAHEGEDLGKVDDVRTETRAVNQWPGPNEKQVITEMLENRDSVHWEMCSELMRRLILKETGKHPILFSADLVEEIWQNAMMSVIAGLPDFRSDSKFTTWLTRIAYTRTIDALRLDHQAKRRNTPMNNLIEGREHSTQEGLKVDADQEKLSLSSEPDAADISDDLQLAALATHLKRGVPTVPIDLTFQEELEEELLNVLREWKPSGTRDEMSWRMAALGLGCVV